MRVNENNCPTMNLLALFHVSVAWYESLPWTLNFAQGAFFSGSRALNADNRRDSMRGNLFSPENNAKFIELITIIYMRTSKHIWLRIRLAHECISSEKYFVVFSMRKKNSIKIVIQVKTFAVYASLSSYITSLIAPIINKSYLFFHCWSSFLHQRAELINVKRIRGCMESLADHVSRIKNKSQSRLRLRAYGILACKRVQYECTSTVT